MKEYLTDLEIAKIEAFNKDEAMVEAVKKVLLACIYTHGTVQKGLTPNPLQNAAFNLASLSVSNPIPDEELGANIRGMWAGVNYLKNGFDELERIKSVQTEVETPYNEAI
jgi:hypothetical protein